MNCDLHTHSVFSDGTDTPTQLILEAKAQGLTIALTDHNTTAGLPEFMAAAREHGVTAVAGTELSTLCQGHELHLLGLFIAPEQYAAVERLAKEFHVLKEISNMEMVERLNDAGYHIDYLDVKRRNPAGNANRAHMAAELMEKGYVDSIAQAFQTILAEDAGFYIPPARLDTVDAVEFLKEIRALPVLAHPLKDLTPEECRRILPQLVQAGLAGMETQHSAYDDDTIALARQIAEEFGLLESGGSDHHGSTKPTIRLGVGEGNLCIPHSVYTTLLQAWQQRYA